MASMPKNPTLRMEPLTERERLYIVLACRKPEPSKAEIAVAMGKISEKTVERFRCKAYEKLGVHTKVELYIKAVEMGLITCACVLARERREGMLTPP